MNDYKQVWEVDADGHIIDCILVSKEEQHLLELDGKTIVDKPWEDGLSIPVYRNGVWAEGLPLESLQEIENKSKRDSEIIELKKYLDDTDFYFIRNLDSGKVVPSDVKQRRNEVRQRLLELGL